MDSDALFLAMPLAVVVTVIVWSFADELIGIDKRHGSVPLVLAAMLSLPGWHLDQSDTSEQRIALYRPVADAIIGATSKRDERAFLITQAWYETRFARYVLEDRCHDGPIGARCDRGKAKGPWQVHRPTCKGAWDMSQTQADRLRAGALCALKGYRAGRNRCKSAAGGFAAQHIWSHRPGWCVQPWAIERAKTMGLIEARL